MSNLGAKPAVQDEASSAAEPSDGSMVLPAHPSAEAEPSLPLPSSGTAGEAAPRGDQSPLPDGELPREGEALRDGGESPARAEGEGDTASSQKGFSTKYQKGSLVEWLALVEFVEGDALVTIESSDGREGYLWCSGGQIIDARCDTLTGEGAFFEIVGTEAGKVSLSFAKVQRPQVIQSTTKELLTKAAARRAGHQISIAPSPPSTSIVPPTVSGIREHGEGAVAPTFLPPEPTPAPPAHRAFSRRLAETAWAPYVGIGALTLVLGATLMVIFTRVFSRTPAAPPAPAEANVAATLAALATPREGELILDLDVDPPAAEIWLDDAQVGQGHVRRQLVRDGREHEIRLVAPGYVGQSILFRDASLVRRVFMEKIVTNRPAVEAPPAAVDHAAPRAPERPAHAAETRPKRPTPPAPSAPKTAEPSSAESSTARPPDAPPRAPDVPLPSRPKAPSRNTPKVQIVD